MPLDWNTGALAKGLACYRNREFFEAHEHWEDVWRAAANPERTLLQGLIQVAAAFHHLQRQNTVGACALLQSALSKLETFPPDFEGLALAPVCESIRAWIAVLCLPAAMEHPGELPAVPPI